MKRAALAALIVSATAPVAAEQTYAAYEGAASIVTGTGGTRISKNGIDYWTTGTPPRRYQVLGMLTDARKDRATDGKVLGSKSVARWALEAGGNAVIFGDQNGQTSNISGGVIETRTTTHLLVVKYLDQ